MRKEYDFSNAKKNPYAKRLKRPITIRLDEIPYQTLINLYLRDCAAQQKKLQVAWRAIKKSIA